MRNEIWFDMDGTIADLYGVEGWLDDLLNENTRPYEVAGTLINMQVLARLLNKLAKKGYKIGIISWTAKNGSAEYNKRIATAKREWLNKHLASVKFESVNIIKYGTPKSIVASTKNAILFDDEERNRTEWKGIAYGVDNIIEILKGLN